MRIELIINPFEDRQTDTPFIVGGKKTVKQIEFPDTKKGLPIRKGCLKNITFSSLLMLLEMQHKHDFFNSNVSTLKMTFEPF